MAEFRNTFSQGLDQDSSKIKYDNAHYFSAENIRPITQDGLSSGAIENVLGNLRRLYCYDGSNHFVIGYSVIRDYILLFTTTNNTSVPNGSSTDRIWKVAISSIETLTGTNYFTLSNTSFHLGGNLIYSGNLYFCTGNKIRSVGRFENDNIQKLYWVDGYNNLRHINTIHNADTNNLTTLTADKLEVISDFTITRPELDSFESGNLRTGKVQYTYQLYVLNGGETVFSPMSHLINITESNELATNTDNYEGSDLDVQTGKAVKATIEVEATGYNRIRIVAIHYTTLQADPEIRIVEERDVSMEGQSISFVDAGQNYGTYTLEQIRILGTYLFVPKEISVKDNILFPANITETSFDIDFDARAYRFAGVSATSTDPNYQYTAALRRKCRIYDSQGNYYEGDGATPTGTWIGSGLSNVTGWENIPADFDAINNFNDIDNDGDHNYRFIYQADGVTLGGEGPNIKYTFKIKTVVLDNNAGAQYIRAGLESIPDNPSFTNYASPYQCAQYLGYARDEVYRFGIVFFDEKGRSSFVKWIGDVRMPSISTIGNADTYDPDSGSPTWQVDTISADDYAFGSDCEYRVRLDGNPIPTGYGYTTDEDSEADVMYGIIDALGYMDDITITNINPILFTFDLTYQTAGSHTITVERWIGGTQYSISYTVTTIVDYEGAVGTKRDYSPVFYDTVSSVLKMNILYPEFIVDLVGTEAEDLSYQIVRVRRESNDRSIRAQGIVTGTYASSNDRYPYSWSQETSWDTSVVCFNSPEVAFNKNLMKQSGDKLQIVGTYGESQTLNPLTGLYIRKYREILALTDPQDRSSVATAGDEFYVNTKSEVSNGAVVTMDTVTSFIGSLTYNRAMKTSAGVDLDGDKGTNFACQIDSSSWVGLNTAAASRPLVNYRRNVFNYQYSGNTYESRSRNYYMATGRVQTLNEAIIPVFDGDTYISMFDYLHAGWEVDAAAGRCEVSYFPVETSINLDLRMDSCYHSEVIAGIADSSLKYIRELKGIYGPLAEYEQSTDLYIYNSVYSKENTTKIHLIRPFDWFEQVKFDTRILASNIKINNELSDSWLKFGVNSYIDVDPQYGELIALMNINNQMLFFQPKAFGTLSINERALLQTNSISQLSLGISGVLARFDYAKTEIGVSYRDHIVLTQNGLYWVDVINKAMYKFTGGPEELSLMKGMSSWFRTNLTGTLVLADILLFADPAYKEVSVVSSTSGKEFHLVYNEITDSYTSFYSYYPKYVINYNDKVLSSNNQVSFYRHNDTSANRCAFYGASAVPFNITLIVNPTGGDTSIFTNLEWLSEVYNGTDNVYNETFTSLRMSNDYQDTGTVTLTYGSNIKRRLRRWRHTIGRAVYTETGATQSRLDARIRDTYMRLKLEFSNTVARKFIVHDITTFVTVANK